MLLLFTLVALQSEPPKPPPVHHTPRSSFVTIQSYNPTYAVEEDRDVQLPERRILDTCYHVRVPHLGWTCKPPPEFE